MGTPDESDCRLCNGIESFSRSMTSNGERPGRAKAVLVVRIVKPIAKAQESLACILSCTLRVLDSVVGKR